MSKTIISLIVLVVGMLGFGDIFLEAEIATVVNGVMQLAGVLGVWYGRVVASGRVSWLGMKE